MKIIEASYKIVTPMFIGGGNEDVDLRTPSIKGALRFWWRALHWGQCLQDTKSNSDALKRLHQLEAELFGAAVKDERYGQGLFSLKLKNIEHPRIEQSWPTYKGGAAGYIGFGLDTTRGSKGSDAMPHRKGILPTMFRLTLILKNNITDDQREPIKNTLITWGLLGGLGSRARRGYGSVALMEMDNISYQFKDEAAYYREIRLLLSNIVLSPNLPLFTAFSNGMKISTLSKQNKNYHRLMDDLGQQYKDERTSSTKTSDRAIYGLPLDNVDTNNRRSSPLIIHIHTLESGYIGIISFIPADFHYDTQYSGARMQPFFDSVARFMDSMKSIYP